MKTTFRKSIERACYQFLLVCIALYSPAGLAQQDAVAAGRVVVTRGQVSAIDTDGNTRELARGREIFVGDTVVTGAAGFAQIRMTDSAIVSLKEATRFEIVAYAYEENPNTDVSTMRLIEGGFRTITGQIGGADNPDAYTVETQFANIGIRGTDHE
ncbi:MAG: FecR domain-containing protein, partial [Pseudohongiellaceae bacterium]